jgi:hypothetical protein
LAVFAAPALPEGWHGGGAIRIIDPLGVQAAWIAPHRAGVIGYYARSAPGMAWIEVLGGRHTGSLGCELLVRDARSGQMRPLDAAGPAWEFIARDPTAATLRGTAGTHSFVMSISCEDDGLRLSIGAAASDGFGLRIRPAQGIARVIEESPRGGEARLNPGPLVRLSWRHSPALAAHCHRRTDELDFVPAPGGTHHDEEFVLTLQPYPSTD